MDKTETSRNRVNFGNKDYVTNGSTTATTAIKSKVAGAKFAGIGDAGALRQLSASIGSERISKMEINPASETGTIEGIGTFARPTIATT